MWLGIGRGYEGNREREGREREREGGKERLIL